jgi:hypothetical protein
MKNLILTHSALSVRIAAITLASWIGTQLLIGAVGAIPKSGNVLTPDKNRASCPTATCIYVADDGDGGSGNGGITIFRSDASGDVRPYRTISGLTNPSGVAVDQRGRTYVALPATNDVSVYAASANGNAPTLFTIGGRRTRIVDPQGLAFDSTFRLHVLSNVINELGRLTAYQAGAKGDARPIDTIYGKKTRMRPPVAIAMDTSGNTYVTRTISCFIGCFGKNQVLIYAAGAHGDAVPTWKIGGSKTQLTGPHGVALDSSGNVYVANFSAGSPPSLTVYAAGAHGNVAPTRVISGSATELSNPTEIYVASSGNIYVTNTISQYAGSVTVYAAGSNGNVSPIQMITGSKTGLVNPDGIVVH